jgi:hypothetical protein
MNTRVRILTAHSKRTVEQNQSNVNVVHEVLCNAKIGVYTQCFYSVDGMWKQALYVQVGHSGAFERRSLACLRPLNVVDGVPALDRRMRPVGGVTILGYLLVSVYNVLARLSTLPELVFARGKGAGADGCDRDLRAGSAAHVVVDRS